MASNSFRTRWHISEFLSDDEAQQLRLVLSARRALGEWLKGDLIWHHVIHPTFAQPPTEQRAWYEFERWTRWLEMDAQQAVGWCAALERGVGGRLHYHVLTVGTEALTPNALVKAWRGGRATGEVYDPCKGAAFYLIKSTSSDAVDLTFDVAPAHKLVRVAPTLDLPVATNGCAVTGDAQRRSANIQQRGRSRTTTTPVPL